MATELSRNAVIKTYARWAPVYDVVFGSVFENARRMAVEASERVGGRILEGGVGTGISLPNYSARSRVVGIDISEPMLKVARRRVIDEGLEHVANALLKLPIAFRADPAHDGHFDVYFCHHRFMRVDLRALSEQP